MKSKKQFKFFEIGGFAGILNKLFFKNSPVILNVRYFTFSLLIDEFFVTI